MMIDSQLYLIILNGCASNMQVLEVSSNMYLDILGWGTLITAVGVIKFGVL